MVEEASPSVFAGAAGLARAGGCVVADGGLAAGLSLAAGLGCADTAELSIAAPANASKTVPMFVFLKTTALLFSSSVDITHYREGCNRICVGGQADG
ncbi:MAG: hypothetical protein ABI589_06205 [Burkholderiales bacterium]